MQLGSLSTKLLIVLVKISPPLVKEIVLLIFYCNHYILKKDHRCFGYHWHSNVVKRMIGEGEGG